MNRVRSGRNEPMLLVSLLAVLSAFVGAMVYQSVHWPADSHRATPLAVLTPYWITFALAWALLGVAAWRWRGVSASAADPVAPPVARPIWLIVLVALGARLVVVFGCEPRLSDDIWRYIHDGRTLARGHSPFAAPPQDVVPTDDDHAELIGRINHPMLVSIYQPASQYVFAAFSMLQVEAWDGAGDRTFRLGFVGIDMVIIAMLLGGLRVSGRSPWWVILYAWHPLPISEIAGSGHQDGLGIAPLVAALLLAQRPAVGPGSWPCAGNTGGTPHCGRAGGAKVLLIAAGAGAALALAVAVKPIVLPLALVLAWALRSQPKRLMAATAAALAVGVALYAPLLLADGGLDGMFETVRRFMDKWAYNGSLHPVVQLALGDKRRTDGVMAALLLAVLIGCAARSLDPCRAALAYLLGGLLFSSTAHPWYLLWSLALLPLCVGASPEAQRAVAARSAGPCGRGAAGGRGPPGVAAAVWILSLTITWSYTAYLNPIEFQPRPWVIVAEYAPVYAVMLWLWIHTLALSRTEAR